MGPTHAAVVVAGGRSQRFGPAEKATAEVGGEPMLRRVVTALTPAVDQVVVNCRAEQHEAFEGVLADVERPVRFALDPVPDRGPVYGLRTALRRTTAESVFVAACDVPALDPALVDCLFDRLSGADAAVPAVDDQPLPLCAAYDAAAALDSCEAAIACGATRLRDVLDRLDVASVDESLVRAHAASRAALNVNTRADLAAADRTLGD